MSRHVVAYAIGTHTIKRRSTGRTHTKAKQFFFAVTSFRVKAIPRSRVALDHLLNQKYYGLSVG